MGRIFAGVLGRPVSHSLSPEIFQFLSKNTRHARGSELEYHRWDFHPRNVPSLFDQLRGGAFVGCNITIPYKETALKSLDRISPEAAGIGAVNVLERVGPCLVGHNTDCFGVEATLREHEARVSGKAACIFGSGGAARAAAYALGKAQAGEVLIWNRNPVRATALVSRFSRLFRKTRFALAGRKIVKADLFINATPVGTEGFGQKPGFRLEEIAAPGAGATAFDMVYRPENTVFLQSAKRAGMRTIGGLDMLVWQALRTWEIWFDPITERDKTKAALKRFLKGKLQ